MAAPPVTANGIAAPAGYLWARDPSGLWHVLRAAELTDAKTGDYRRLVRSVCGEWGSVTPWTPGHWAVITRWLPLQPWMCSTCVRGVAAAGRALESAAQEPPAEQGRLF
jgi:hypothetical protein